MKFVVISDTHGKHLELTDMPTGDVIIHAGDVTKLGGKSEVYNFLEWFSKLPYKYRIFVAGNHDFYFDYDWKSITTKGKSRFKDLAKLYTKEDVEKTLALFPGVTYLNDNGIEIEGIKIFGSPVSPWYHDWAFNRMRGADIKAHWDKIPLETDILITHGPADKILDITAEGVHTGCAELLQKIVQTKVKFHICGHIHEAAGSYETGDGRKFINASVLNRDYYLTNKPVVFEIKK